nr:hypothetical protein [Mucilaginibacter sp. SP1R1]
MTTPIAIFVFAPARFWLKVPVLHSLPVWFDKLLNRLYGA